jgi:HPt (histidine-containing phosphotransfer) domain-containing protein
VRPDAESLRALRDLMGEDFGSVVRLYLKNTDSLMARLGTSPAIESEAGEFVREVHAFKSSCRYMGARDMANLAEMLESTARAFQSGGASLQDVQDLLESLRAGWSGLRGAYEDELKENSAGGA